MLKARLFSWRKLKPLALASNRQFSETSSQTKFNDDLFTRLPPSAMQPKRIVPLRGYLYLPGNQDMGIPQYLKGPTEDFPVGVQCGPRQHFTSKDWAEAIREFMDEYLPIYKGILFRGIPVKDGVDFNNLLQNTRYSPLAYKFGTDFRYNVTGSVYGASTMAPPCIIEMHNEGSYSPSALVRKIFFFCQSPADIGFGGETPICKNESFMKDIDENFLAKLRSKKLRYLRFLPHRDNKPEACWQHAMIVETKEEAEESMRKVNVEWRWNPNGDLISWHTKSAFLEHPDTGEEVFFNQATSHHRSYYDHLSQFIPSSNFEDYPGGFHSQYGDGEEIEDEYLQQVRSLSWQETVGVQLDAGDVLVLDNLACQHGRLNYHGIRKVFLALTTD